MWHSAPKPSVTTLDGDQREINGKMPLLRVGQIGEGTDQYGPRPMPATEPGEKVGCLAFRHASLAHGLTGFVDRDTGAGLSPAPNPPRRPLAHLAWPESNQDKSSQQTSSYWQDKSASAGIGGSRSKGRKHLDKEGARYLGSRCLVALMSD